MIQKNGNSSEQKQNQVKPIQQDNKNKQLEKSTDETSNKSQGIVKGKIPFLKTLSKGEWIQIGLLLTNFIMVFSFIIISSNQRKDTQEALKLTRESLIRSDSSLAISQKGLELSQQNFITENRPFIGIHSITLNKLKVGEKMAVNIIIQNYGKTPAKQVKIFSWIDPHTTPSYIDFKFDDSVIDTGYAAMPPTGTINSVIQTQNAINENNFKAIVDKKWFIYVYGRVTYSDMFDMKDTTLFYYIYDYDASGFKIISNYNEIK